MRSRTGVVMAVLGAALLAPHGVRADEPATQPAEAPAPAAPVDAPAGADEFLTEAQLVQAYRARQFPMIVHEVVRIQNNPAEAARVKLFDLVVLKAESQLQMKDIPVALASFNEAAKLAPDDDRKAVMLATAMLLRRQFEWKYLSRTTDDQGQPLLKPRKLADKPAGIDLLDLSKRTIALRALCSDEIWTANELLGRGYTSIPALEPLFKTIDDVSITERAAAGTQSETKKLQVKTAQLAGRIISTLIKTDTAKADQFKNAAAMMVSVPNSGGNFGRGAGRYGNANGAAETQSRLRGLTVNEAAQLQDMIAMTMRVPDETKKLVDRLHVDANFYDVIIADAGTLKKLAQGILDSTPVYGYQ